MADGQRTEARGQRTDADKAILEALLCATTGDVELDQQVAEYFDKEVRVLGRRGWCIRHGSYWYSLPRWTRNTTDAFRLVPPNVSLDLRVSENGMARAQLHRCTYLHGKRFPSVALAVTDACLRHAVSRAGSYTLDQYSRMVLVF